MSAEPNQVTRLLDDWRSGRQEALNQLMPLVYDQLRTIAQRQLSGEKPGHTLRATELVHEAYLKLLGSNVSVSDRAHFYALASRVIRHVLINHGAAKSAGKRDGGVRVELEEAALFEAGERDSFFEIHEALERLEVFDPRKVRVVEMVFFGGLEQDLAAEVLGISPATVRRELRMAKAWLSHELGPRQKAAQSNQ